MPIKRSAFCWVALFFAFLNLSGNKVYSQPTPPSLRCIAVENNGNVTLTWIVPTDTGTVFGGYHVFSGNSSAGPFVAVDSIFNYNTLTTTVTSVNATNTILYFYIRTREGCCSAYSISSDTLKTMKMIVTPMSNEHVRLNWNRIHNPPLSTTSGSFILSKELTPGVFSPFRNLTDTTSLDTNYYCNKFINYRVSQSDLSGCQSVSSIDGELFRDSRGPAQTLIDTVSVDLITGNAVITWFPDSSADTQGYVIYQFNGISYDSIGTVAGINSLQYINALSNASAFPETYTVAAYDSCKNLGSLAVNHKTVHLEHSFIKCEALVNLTWTSYINIEGGLSRYEIWVRENSGPWLRDGFVPVNTFSYDKVLTNAGANYEFVIRAVGTSGKTSTSNLISVIADIFDQPDFLYIRSASVTGSSVEVVCHVDAASDVQSYILYRSSSSAGSFTPVESINYIPSTTIIFTDVFADADKQQRFYKITARDSCGQEFVTSNIAGTVFLSAEGGNDYTSSLTWMEYSGWQSEPGSYHIYRVINDIRAASPFAWVSGDTLFFEEDVSEIAISLGNLCYTIMASEDSVNTFGFSDSAFSNISCAPQAPAAYIPNAFTPGGKNPVFKPFLIFEDASSYSLRIYNRWGQLVFLSEVPEQGWDGKYNGRNAPVGLYAYLMVFKGLNKKEIRRSGTITLIR